MKLIKLLGSGFFQILSLTFVIAYLLGVLNIYFSDKNSYCVMTYMFEYPQFVRISINENRVFPQYGLYAYSEGRFTERARKMWFDGIPVLFLPGNSGSHKQARSLASVALRKALSNTYEYHFDFFTVSYNEELSGLYGGVLQSQTEFAAASVLRILSLYKSNKYTKSVPSTVILIGHSMGGLIVKRLLAYPSTINNTTIAITLAAPVQAPVMNFDGNINDYYVQMDKEWAILNKNELRDKKVVISIGSGPRDLLVPAGLTSTDDSDVNALTTSIPGVWVSPDHISIVWCKQLVMVINRFLFDIVDRVTDQITVDHATVAAKARLYFQANRSMIFDSDIQYANVTLNMEGFWYEDNRRIYQISRPEIDRTTYLMIRLVTFPQNRFVAIESTNVDDRDWIFGCNAKYVHKSYRYCKEATSLSEFSRWTGSATNFGRRKLATVHLHSIIEHRPDWTHVVVKISPTRKPVVLNVDINDHASRQINVNLPSEFSFSKHIIIRETESNCLYYELILQNFNMIHQAYLLYIEPVGSCEATEYHVSAEMHVPWAENHENFHYFTHIKRTPMKLRLFKSNPNESSLLEPNEKVKITILLDPQCTFSISISQSWYHQLAQFSRHYTPMLVPYVAGIILLAARSNILHLKEHGTCLSIHNSLMSEGVKPYYALVFGRLGTMTIMSVPLLAFIFENASWKNLELQYFARSLLVLPVYMTALGIVNIAATAVLISMIFSSQIAHRFLFRIVWRGGSSVAEKMTAGLQRVPLVVSAALVFAAPVSCGAASLVAGAAFYSFMLSKMYEDYLEDYVYKLLSKIASKLCYMFKSQKAKVTEANQSQENSVTENLKAIESKKMNTDSSNKTEETENEKSEMSDTLKVTPKKSNTRGDTEKSDETKDKELDEDLNNLNFHMMLFFLWLTVTIVNIPALLTWAKNFKYSMVLKPDSSFPTGLVMAACSTIIWQINGPKKNLKYYDIVSLLLFSMAIFILALGPFSLTIVNYGVTFVFVVITIQQLYDVEMPSNKLDSGESIIEKNYTVENASVDSLMEQEVVTKENDSSQDKNSDSASTSSNTEENISSDENCECNENRIYNIFKRFKEKFTFNDNL